MEERHYNLLRCRSSKTSANLNHCLSQKLTEGRSRLHSADLVLLEKTYCLFNIPMKIYTNKQNDLEACCLNDLLLEEQFESRRIYTHIHSEFNANKSFFNILFK